MSDMFTPVIPPIRQSHIGDHGVIGNLCTAALVDRRGGIDWLCWPDFDSSPIFNHILDPAGGRWDVSPAIPFQADRVYLAGTNILQTCFVTETGRATLTDFMVLPSHEARSAVVRMVTCEHGTVPMEMRLAPTPGFSATPARLDPGRDGVWIATEEHRAVLTANRSIRVNGAEAGLRHEIEPGSRLVMSLTSEPVVDVESLAARTLDETRSWWSAWLDEVELPSFAADLVERSALTLKLLAYESGGLVAAPTTSLPEVIGGERNWDYRYSWLRDSSEAVLSLERLSHTQEAASLWDWLSRADEHGDGSLAVAYTIRGEEVPREREIDLLAGHRGSRPVRVGNGARDQRQLDIYGHILRAAAHGHERLGMDLTEPHDTLVGIADRAAAEWEEADESIWEVRGGPKQYLYSKLMCWLALDKALDLHADGVLEGDTSAWESARAQLRDAVLDRGWSEKVNAFAMTLDGEDLDAAALTIPIVGFLPAGDERCRSTRQRVHDELSESGLVHRYLIDDTLEGDEGAFLLCSFWLADAYTLDDDPDSGAEVFEAAAGAANDLLLLPEEVDAASGEPLGNFPQGLSHLGLIASALRLAEFDS